MTVRTGRSRWARPTLAMLFGVAATFAIAWAIRLLYASGNSVWPIPHVGAGTVLERPFDARATTTALAPDPDRGIWLPISPHNSWLTTPRLNVPGLVSIESEPGQYTHPWFYRTEIGRRADVPAWSVLTFPPIHGRHDRNVSETAVGWPWLALRTRLGLTHPSTPAPPTGLRIEIPMSDIVEGDYAWSIRRATTALPIVPVWPGFFLNLIAYATPFYLASRLLGVLGRARRRRRGLCVQRRCKYPLRGLAVCPECGTAQPPRTSPPPPADHPPATPG